MARMVAVFSATAAGAAITAASTAGPAIQHTTMVSTWPGRIPSALKIPRSCTRSRVVISPRPDRGARPAAMACTADSRPARHAGPSAASAVSTSIPAGAATEAHQGTCWLPTPSTGPPGAARPASVSWPNGCPLSCVGTVAVPNGRPWR